MLSRRIRELRTALGWSQVELARRLNITKQAVSNWENDNIQPSIEMLSRLADAFHVTTDYLLGREELLRLDISGIPDSAAAHLMLLVEDYRELLKQ